ncbi:MAG: carbohydrate ABC transporter permease [Oliverpabstia sp.]
MSKDKFKKIFFTVLKYVILILVSLSVIYPLVGVVLSSFKTKIEYLITGSMTRPESFSNLSNYVTAFTKGNVVLGFKNTLIIIVFACLFSTLMCTMVAFCLCRFEFRGKKIIDTIYMIASFVPGVIVHLIIFRNFASVGLVDNLFSVVLLYSGVDIVSLYLYKQYLSQISKSLDESAIIDGCSYLGIYGRIILPMLKPAITTACIIKIVYVYNDFYTAFLYLPSDSKGVMSTVLYRFMGPYSSEWAVIAAGIIIVSLPIFVGFIFAQKYIYAGFASGAVKG